MQEIQSISKDEGKVRNDREARRQFEKISERNELHVKGKYGMRMFNEGTWSEVPDGLFKGEYHMFLYGWISEFGRWLRLEGKVIFWKW